MSFPDSIALKQGEVIRTGTLGVAPLGTRGTTPDGRVFRYCKAGGAITIGGIVQMEAGNVIATVPQTSNLVLATDLAYGLTISTTFSQIAVKATLWGNATAIVANNFKEGYLMVGGTGRPTGSGQMFKIKSHTGLTASSTTPPYIVFTLEDGEHPETAFTTDVAIGFRKNAYDDVILVVYSAEPTAPVVGIAQCAVASGDYFWVQTWGTGMALVGSATTARVPLVTSTDAAVTGLAPVSQTTGGDSQPTLSKNQVIAYSPDVIVAGGLAPVEIKINP